MVVTVVDGFVQKCRNVNIKSKKIFILGAGGFIGKRIYDKFLEEYKKY